MKPQSLISILIPAYNHEKFVEGCVRSVLEQDWPNVELLVVDDGSTDNTEELFERLVREADFPIQYKKKENGGKGRAINYGLDFARGELFFNVDSDDYLTDDALEKVARWESAVAGDSRFCGVVGNLGTSETYSPNTPVSGEYRDASLLERYREYTDHPIDGEHAFIFYTDIQKKYRYPEFEGEKFITPGIPWNRMAHDGYLVRVFNDIIWVYEYQPDGLTMSGANRFIQRPQGHGLWLREKAEFCGASFADKLRMWYTFYCDHTLCDEKYRITKKQCAEYIGAPYPFILAAAVIHKIKP